MFRGRKKNKKKQKKSIYEIIFIIISIIALFSIVGYYSYRLVYYYQKQNNVQTSKHLADLVIESNEITKEKDGFHKVSDGYSFKGNVLNNYVKIGNRLYRIMQVNDDKSVKIVSDTIQSILIWGDENSYETSNLNIWLDKGEENYSGVYYNTIPNELIKKTKYQENRLSNKKIVKSKNIYSSNITTLTIDDYINYNGKSGYLNNGQYFWLIGKNNNSSNLYVSEDGSVEEAESYDAYGVRPVFTLSKKVMVASGNGTIEDPYTISLQQTNSYVGNYVRLGNDIWYVYSDDGQILKLSLNNYITLNNQEVLKKFSNRSSEYDIKDRTGLAYYLNTTYYQSLPYKQLLLDNQNYVGEISNETGFSIKNIYTDTTTSKVSLLNIFDYNGNSALTDYYYLNNTSSVGSMAYVNNNKGFLEEDAINQEKHIVPTISINKNILKNGAGTVDNPFVTE